MRIKIINKSKHELPQYQTEHSAGLDLTANIDQPITLAPRERTLVPTGFFISLPSGYEAQIRPRSGLALKHGVSVVNAPGTIDPDYRGEIGIILINLGQEPFVVNDGERIAQMVISKYEKITWQEVDQLDQTKRGEQGYGHTGK